MMNFLKVLLLAASAGVYIAIKCNYGVAGSTIKEIECESPYLKCMMQKFGTGRSNGTELSCGAGCHSESSGCTECSTDLCNNSVMGFSLGASYLLVIALSHSAVLMLFK